MTVEERLMHFIFVDGLR